MKTIPWCWSDPPLELDNVPYSYALEDPPWANSTGSWYCWYLDDQCNASLKGDSDIGGFGVGMSAQLLTALLTLEGVLLIHRDSGNHDHSWSCEHLQLTRRLP